MRKKSPLVWTRFIRDSIVCVSAIENSLLETMPAVLIEHNKQSRKIDENWKHGTEGCSMRMCEPIHILHYCIVYRTYLCLWQETANRKRIFIISKHFFKRNYFTMILLTIVLLSNRFLRLNKKSYSSCFHNSVIEWQIFYYIDWKAK